MNQRRQNRRPYGILLTEYGLRFDDWTTHATNSGIWDGVNLNVEEGKDIISWQNNSGTATGSAMHRLAYADVTYPAPTGYEDAHTVHARCSLHTLLLHWGIGPATALTGTSATGYMAGAYTTGLALLQFTTATVATLATAASVQLEVGDVLSLGYRYNTLDSEADLTVSVNGTTKISFTDTSAPYRMSSLSARPGLYGDINQSIPNALTYGHQCHEWWVTAGFDTFDQPEPYYPGRIRG